MVSLNPYLNFNGNCEEAFYFYQSVFGGSFAMVMRFKEASSKYPVPESDEEKIMHIALQMDNGSVLMGSDAPAAMEQAITGSNIQISISATGKEEADRLYNGLSAGGTATMPMADTFWGSYFGMLTDSYGIQWMVSYDAKYA